MWSPLPSHKFFRLKKILKNEGFPYETFRYCEKINFRQNCDTTSYAIFLKQKVSERQGFPYEVFWYCETKKFRQKVVISHFYPKSFSIKELFRKMKGSPTNFSVLWETQFSTKPWYIILCTFFNSEIFWNKRVLQGAFSVLCDKKFSREIRDIPPPIHKIFRQKKFWKIIGSPTKLFGAVRKSNFDKIVIHHLMQIF